MERDSSTRRNHLVEFSCKKTTMQRVQLQTNRPVERSIEEATLLLFIIIIIIFNTLQNCTDQ